MKKCLKFQEFKKKYKGVEISSDDILKEFVDEYESKNDEEKSDENDYIDALNMSPNESEDVEHKRNENKYMPPLPGMGNNIKKKLEIKIVKLIKEIKVRKLIIVIFR